MQNELFGRDDERARLRAAIAATAAGFAHVAVVEGVPGIGKTALLDVLVRDAIAAGITVLRSDADEGDTGRPLGVLLDALASTSPGPTAVSATLRQPGVSPIERRHNAVDAWWREVDEMAATSPTVVVVDDLQWADEASVHALRRGVRQPRFAPVTLVLARRRHPRTEAMAGLDAAIARTELPVVHVDLGPLSETAVRQLVASAVGGAVDEVLLSEVKRADGNPLFVREVVRAVRSGAGGASLADLLRRRPVAREAERAVEVAAVAGRRVDPALLAAVLGSAVGPVLAILDGLVEDGVLRHDGNDLEFTHDLLREAVYESIPAATRRALHHATAQAMTTLGGDALVVARHFVRGASTGDRVAIEWLRRAAAGVAATSPPIASDLLHHAIELAGHDDHLRWSLLGDRATLLADVGQLDEAARIADDILDGRLTAEDEAKVRFGVARALGVSGRFADAERVAGPLDDLPPEFQARWSAARSAALAHTGQLEAAWDAAQRGKRLGRSLGQPGTVAVARHTEGLVLRFRGEFARAAALLADVEPRLGRDATSEHTLLVLEAGYAALLADDVTLAAARLEAARRACETRGWLGYLPPVIVALCAHAYLTGRWDTLTDEFDSLVRLADDMGVPAAYGNPYVFRARVCIARDDLDGARAITAMARSVPALAAGGPLRWADVALLRAEGRHDEERTVAEAAWGETRNDMERLVHVTDVVRCALSADDRTSALTAATVAAQIGERAGTASAGAVAGICAGLVDADHDAVARSAETLATTGAWPFEAATALADAARLAAASGDRGAAGDLATAAATRFEALGATRSVRELGGLGGPAPSRRAPRRPTTGWASLTPAQRRVADLVASGRSNREIAGELGVSLRTVETHLTHVFAKLHLRSRVELAIVVRDH